MNGKAEEKRIKANEKKFKMNKDREKVLKKKYLELMEADAKRKIEQEAKRKEHEEELFIIDLQKAYDKE